MGIQGRPTSNYGGEKQSQKQFSCAKCNCNTETTYVSPTYHFLLTTFDYFPQLIMIYPGYCDSQLYILLKFWYHILYFNVFKCVVIWSQESASLKSLSRYINVIGMSNVNNNNTHVRSRKCIKLCLHLWFIVLCNILH